VLQSLFLIAWQAIQSKDKHLKNTVKETAEYQSLRNYVRQKDHQKVVGVRIHLLTYKAPHWLAEKLRNSSNTGSQQKKGPCQQHGPFLFALFPTGGREERNDRCYMIMSEISE
jgi:hypothetical protein